MLTLTTPVAVPNITRLRVRQVAFDADASEATVVIEVLGAGGVVYEGPQGNLFTLIIRNGTSVGLRVTANPVKYNDRVGQFSTPTPTGFTDLVAAYMGATLAARNRGAESAGVAAGWLAFAGVVA